MKMNGHTILITGGGSGIGLALSESFAALGNQMIVAGRSAAKLEAAAKKGFATFAVDMTSPESIQVLAQEVIKKFPALNGVIHNAGIMKNEKLTEEKRESVAEATIATNLLGPLRLTDALLPHLLKQSSGMIMTVSSGLAFVPLAMTPTYSATKAAIHSYTQSLRYQLKDTAIDVIELIPPYVQTQLMGDRQANDPNAMPLKDFIAEVMQILKDDPQAIEVAVKRVNPLRYAAEEGRDKYRSFFKQFNDQVSAARQGE